MDTASVETQDEYGDEMVDATEKEIDGRSFDLANCPNVVNTALKVAETEYDLTDVAYLGAAGVVPPAAVVPSSFTTRNLTGRPEGKDRLDRAGRAVGRWAQWAGIRSWACGRGRHKLTMSEARAWLEDVDKPA